jgi:[FeFe] hydrogenase H-cluster maturation GTPase HydF
MANLNETVSAERVHISFFGRRNAGKSSLVNAVAGQEVSIVSEVKGTTTDPVKKAMELLPLGPVLLTDTPGYDDEGGLGELRVQKTRETLARTDIAVLVADATLGLTTSDKELLTLFKERKLPHIIVFNKSDLTDDKYAAVKGSLTVSAKTGEGIAALKERLGAFAETLKTDKKILADLVNPGDTVILVIPIDGAAPKGRIILPQQQTLRELLDCHCTALCCQPEELSGVIANLKTPPALVVTDSQVFGRVNALLPPEIPLTSFSILFARYKGELRQLTEGAEMLRQLKDGDKVLIAEGCTHRRQCGDIGTEKLPRWIEGYCGAKPAFSFTSGAGFPQDLSEYRLVVHCGGCMLNEAEMKDRLRRAAETGVPTVNYGVAIAKIHGILDRSTEMLPELR